jgi:hypothetical protein
LYVSPNVRVIKSMKMTWAGHVARMGGVTDAYNIFIGKQSKRPLGRHRRKREDNVGLDLRELGWREAVGWMYLAQDRAVLNTEMNLRVP